MKQCADPIGAGCSHIYRRIYRYNPEIHGDLYLYNIYLNNEHGRDEVAARHGRGVEAAASASRLGRRCLRPSPVL
jgi:hypothetical protein